MEVLCGLHKEKLKLFCVEDQQLICLICRDSEAHRGHSFSPFNEAAPANKEDMNFRVEPLREKLKAFIDYKLLCEQTVMHVQMQTQHTESRLRAEFEKLHEFLLAEEASRMKSLAAEQEEKTEAMKKRIEKINADITSLIQRIRTIEEEIGANDITFLQNYKTTLQRTQCPLKEPEKAASTLINEAKYLGNLRYKIWNKMRDMVTHAPVILDPNTASYSLILSEDLTSLKRADDRQWLPDNPERFDVYISVLGSEGLNKGTHTWDVEVADNPLWLIGIMAQSLSRKGDYNVNPGLRYICYKDEKYWARSTPLPKSPLHVDKKLKKIRLELNWEQGELKFTDAVTNGHLITFTHTFTEPVFPYFSTNASLKIVSSKP